MEWRWSVIRACRTPFLSEKDQPLSPLQKDWKSTPAKDIDSFYSADKVTTYCYVLHSHRHWKSEGIFWCFTRITARSHHLDRSVFCGFKVCVFQSSGLFFSLTSNVFEAITSLTSFAVIEHHSCRFHVEQRRSRTRSLMHWCTDVMRRIYALTVSPGRSLNWQRAMVNCRSAENMSNIRAHLLHSLMKLRNVGISKGSLVCFSWVTPMHNKFNNHEMISNKAGWWEQVWDVFSKCFQSLPTHGK